MAEQLYPGDHVRVKFDDVSRDGILVQVYDNKGETWGEMYCTGQSAPTTISAPLTDYVRRPGPRARELDDMCKTIRYLRENWKEHGMVRVVNDKLDELYEQLRRAR